ncbi:hypothetical protein B0H19DRAFT_1074508 [Mycena capillaripes]|nr:hypothetical protein B0H19DRAFT_1074508 [Mycena capillaripes]
MSQTYSLFSESSASPPPSKLALRFLSVHSGSIPNVPGPHLGVNLYVKIDIKEGGTRRKYMTLVAIGSLAPKWNFEQTICSLSSCSSSFSASANITFRLCHKTVVEKVVGQFTATISELLQQCTAHNDAPVEFDIQADDSVMGKLCVLLKANTMDQLREAANHELLKTQQDIVEISLTSAVSHAAGTNVLVVGITKENKDLGSALLKVASQLKPLVEMGDKIAKALDAKLEADQKILELVETMAEVYSFTSDVDFLEAKNKLLDDAILQIAIQTVECSFFIREYTGHGFLGNLGRTTFTDVSEKIEKFSQCLKRLKQQFEHGTEMQTLFFSAKIVKGVETLEHLGIVHPETNVCWLSGVAGSGKSTIANTVAQHFRNLQRLGVYIYFDRSTPHPNILAVVVHSIAYWLAKFNVYFESALCAALDTDPSLVTAHFSIQVQKLLHEPLKAACTHICGPVVIILDALDECLDSNSRVTLARWIASEEFAKLPSVFQLLITSRPDSDIRNHFQNKKHITTQNLTLLDNTESDIERYFCAGLQEIQQSHALEPEWPGVTAIHMLTQLSGNLFIWAATAYRFINQYNPEKKLELLFKSGSTISESLNNLYTVALNSCARWDDPDFCNDACLVLALVTLWQVPLNDKEMDLLLELKSGTSAKILTKLACVFQWTSGNHPRPLHASFSDYLLASNRSGEHPWHINTRAWNSVLALKCLRILNSKLKFNICELKTSYLRNAEVPNLSGKIQECISSDLAYASRFWAAHVKNADSEKTILDAVKDFMFTQFLYWLEVLSLSGHVSSANKSLSQALHCLQVLDL